MGVYPVSGPASIRVEVQMGHVSVVAEPRDDVSVAVEPANQRRSGDRNAAESVRVSHTGADISVVGPFRLNLFGPGDSIDVVVRVPEALRCLREPQVRIGAGRGTHRHRRASPWTTATHRSSRPGAPISASATASCGSSTSRETRM